MLLVLCAPVVTQAADEASAPAAESHDSIWTRDKLFGDWGGLRSSLGKHGINLGTVCRVWKEREWLAIDRRDNKPSVSSTHRVGQGGVRCCVIDPGKLGISFDEKEKAAL